MLVCDIILLYLLISFIEWFVHKHIMHGDESRLRRVPFIGDYMGEIAKDHHKHHKEVLMNMRYKHRKTTDGFNWRNTVCMVIVLILFFKIYTNKYVIVIPLITAILYSFLWNTIHNHMHRTTETISYTYGVPSVLLTDESMFSNNCVYKALYKNHAIHHLQKGNKYNYNIICPFFDYIFLTKQYGNCYDNTSYCKKNYSKDPRCAKKQIGCV